MYEPSTAVTEGMVSEYVTGRLMKQRKIRSENADHDHEDASPSPLIYSSLAHMN